MAFTYLLGSAAAATTGGATTGSWITTKGQGKDFTLYAWGTWNSSVLTIEARPAAGTTTVPAYAITGSSLTADGYLNLSIEAHQIRATHTAGSTSGTTQLRVGVHAAS